MLTIPSSSFRAKFSSVTSPSLSPFLSPLSQTKLENWLKFGKTRIKLVRKIFWNFFSYISQSKVVMGGCKRKKNVFLFFLHFFWFFKKKFHFLKKYDSRFLIFRAKFCVATFKFRIFAHIYSIYRCVEKSESLRILLLLVGKNAERKIFRKITFVS